MTDTDQTAPDASLAVGDPTTHALHFHRSTASGKSVVELDGYDIASKLSGLQIVSDVTGTHVALDVHPRALDDVEFAGITRAVVNVYQDDPGPAAAVFLSAIDAEILEGKALNRIDMDNEPHATTRAILAQLIEWATGQGD